MTAFRSLLFAPGNHARRVEKALTLSADAVILDLEDAVAVSEKAAARPMIIEAFDKPRTGKLYVRVNAMSTEWCYGDLVMVIRSGLDGIVLPKVEHAGELRTADWVIGNLEHARGLPARSIDLIPIIETALGFSNLREICGAETRVRRIAFGAGDFT
jgi:citrate lyase subunit beta/citryl-CoA lyase